MEKGNIPQQTKGTPLGLLILICAAICMALSCSPTAYRANGCPYKIYNNKPFNK